MVLDEFVVTSSAVFDESFVVYCVHCLKHLPDECEEHGEAESFSAFKFENFLGFVRRSLRSRKQPLQQLVKRDIEQSGWLLSSIGKDDALDVIEVCLSRLRTQELEEELDGDQYSRIKVKGFTFTTSPFNWCFSTIGKEICIFSNAIDRGNGNIALAGFKFERLQDVYDYPLKSSELGIYKVSDLSEKRYREFSKFNEKCCLYPCDASFFCIPLLECGSQ